MDNLKYLLKMVLGAVLVGSITVMLFTEEIVFNESEAAGGAAVDTSQVEDGTYTGSAEAHNGPLEVEVIVEGGEISDVTVLSHEETDGIADPALEEVPSAIVENNSTEVDTVTGATVTSEAIIMAVNNALSSDGGTAVVPGTDTESESSEEETSEEASGDATYTDGTYEGTAEGHNGPITLEVVIEGGTISDIIVGEHEETEGLSDPAFEEVPAAIIESNGTEVDTVTGATVTSDAIITAVEDALSKASGEETSEAAVTPTYTDGTYSATVVGHNGPLTVEVVVAEGVISDIIVGEHEETDGLSDPAFEEVPAAIIENNSTDVDTVTGATVTSDAIIEAVETALADAQ